MAVRVPEGEAVIRFTYETPGLKAGIVITIGSGLLLLGYCLLCRRLQKKNPALRVKKYAHLAQNPGPEELDAANAYADSVAGKIRARLSHPDGDEKKGSDQE